MNLSKIYKICCIVERSSLENLVPFIMNSAWRQQNIPWNISHIVVNISFLICFEPLFNVFSSYCNIFRFNARNKNKTTVLKAARFFNSAWNLSMTTFCFWPYLTLYFTKFLSLTKWLRIGAILNWHQSAEYWCAYVSPGQKISNFCSRCQS